MPESIKLSGILLHVKNHSPGEWLKEGFVPIMRTRKTPFAKNRSAVCQLHNRVKGGDSK